jgi:hypothetical protein
MQGDPTLVPRDALVGCRIAVSVSESADLGRLGLNVLHLDLTVAEISRAIAIAGGTLIYGGAINHGFTGIVLEEAEQFGRADGAFEHVVPYTEHASRSREELQEYAGSLGVQSTLTLMDADGEPRSLQALPPAHPDRDVAQEEALTAMRNHTAEISDARVIVGGKVADFAGAIPGIAEEAAATLRAGKPLYVAGGFGGAATLVGSILMPTLYEWVPAELPAGLSPEVHRSVETALSADRPADGLDDKQRALLAATFRPSEIATLVVLGLARQLTQSGES